METEKEIKLEVISLSRNHDLWGKAEEAFMLQIAMSLFNFEVLQVLFLHAARSHLNLPCYKEIGACAHVTPPQLRCVKRHCHTAAMRAAPGQIFADTQQDLRRVARWSSSVTPRDLEISTRTRILLHVSSMCTAGSSVVWKSVGAEKPGSAAFHRCMIVSNTQQLALMRSCLPTCTKLSVSANSKSTTAICTGFIFLSAKLPGFVTPLLSSSTPLVTYM